MRRSGIPARRPTWCCGWPRILHDIGKPATRRFEPGGAVSFYHHDLVGAKLAKKRLTALRFDKATIDSVARLIELHLRFFGYADAQWTDSAVRRYVRDAGPELERLHMLTRADVTTRNRRKADRLGIRLRRPRGAHPRAAGAGGAGLRPARPERRAGDAASSGIRPGREVGQAMKFLLELRLDDGPLGEEEATRRLLAWWADALTRSLFACCRPQSSADRDAASPQIRPRSAEMDGCARREGGDMTADRRRLAPRTRIRYPR